MKKSTKLSVIAALSVLIFVGTAHAISFSMRIVGDNDFAIFTGTSTGINHLLYQNNYVWMDQIPNLATLIFDMPVGDTEFYVLGMGGGWQENISGLVNGVDIASNGVSVSMSSDVQSYLTGYNSTTVTNGTYNVNLADVQAAFSHLTWGSPVFNNTDIVIVQAAPNGVGFHFNDSTAHLFSFSTSDVGIQPTPEPGAMLLLGTGIIVLAGLRKKFYNRIV